VSGIVEKQELCIFSLCAKTKIIFLFLLFFRNSIYITNNYNSFPERWQFILIKKNEYKGKCQILDII